MTSILFDEPAPLVRRRRELPEKLGRIVHRCLAKDRERRYQAARDVRNDLEDLEREMRWGTRPEAHPDVPSPYLPAPATRLLEPPPSAPDQTALTAFRKGRMRAWTRPRYRLDREFVALSLLVDRGEDAISGRWGAGGTYRDLGELLERVDDPALVVLGPPGCGKSTLLRRLELDVAQKGLADSDQPLTFFIQLNQYKGERPGDPPPHPLSWLTERWRARYPDLPSLPELLRSGRMILLLDALNEMSVAPGASLHAAVGEWKDFLDRLVSDHPGNRIVFSCRTLDYSAPLSTPGLRVPQVVVEPLTDAQMEQFLVKQSPEHGARIWSRLAGTPQLDLLRSPYFLSLLIDQVEATGDMPEGRAGLFTGFVRQALRREVERGNPLFADASLLTERDLRRITQWRWKTAWELPDRGALVPKLSDLAFCMQAGSEGGGQVRVGYDEALDLLDHPRAETLLKAGLALLVLDEDPGTEEVLYVHQLVQEYFAGRRLAKCPDPERVRARWRARDIDAPLEQLIRTLPPGELLPSLETTGWEDSVIMGAAMAESPDAYVRDLMTVNLVVAGRAAGQAEVRERLGRELLDDLRRALAVRSRNGEADLRSRIEAGLALGALGDPRFEEREGPHGKVLVPPTAAIAGGAYPMGEDAAFEHLGYRIEAHRPRHTVDVRPFRIGVFPVTNGEWARFMESGGYEDPRWWDTVGARRWLNGEGTSAGAHANMRYWRDRFRSDPGKLESAWQNSQLTEEAYERWKQRLRMSADAFEAHLHELHAGGKLREPASWRDARYNNPVQPVVGVSWYEARAYCAWLRMQTGEGYRLPTEAEWEAAVRGREGRRYAWGDAYEALRGNTAATRLRGTTPVGVFVEGDTPEGVSDLTGNVGEWTSSLFGVGAGPETAPFGYPYDAGDGREDPDAAPEVRRVLRGGAWSSGGIVSRSAYRDEDHPDFRSPGFGFRVAADSAEPGRARAWKPTAAGGP
jgi:formylglycine-generating enzyme required for sulfatase activity